MEEIKIKPLTIASWGKFYSFFAGSLKKDYPAFPKKGIDNLLDYSLSKKILKKRFQQGKKKIFLARLKNKLIGYLMASIEPGGVSSLNWIAVLPKWRRQGIGKKLMAVWGEETVASGIHKLNISVTNRENIRFYQHLGFRLEGVRRADYWGKDRYLLGKVMGKYRWKRR